MKYIKPDVDPKKVRIYMIQNDMNINQMAEKLNISRSSFLRILNGNIFANPSVAFKKAMQELSEITNDGAPQIVTIDGRQYESTPELQNIISKLRLIN
jgi:transcriptional regulator with XRE-family HTH domain